MSFSGGSHLKIIDHVKIRIPFSSWITVEELGEEQKVEMYGVLCTSYTPCGWLRKGLLLFEFDATLLPLLIWVAKGSFERLFITRCTIVISAHMISCLPHQNHLCIFVLCQMHEFAMSDFVAV